MVLCNSKNHRCFTTTLPRLIPVVIQTIANKSLRSQPLLPVFSDRVGTHFLVFCRRVGILLLLKVLHRLRSWVSGSLYYNTLGVEQICFGYDTCACFLPHRRGQPHCASLHSPGRFLLQLVDLVAKGLLLGGSFRLGKGQAAAGADDLNVRQVQRARGATWGSLAVFSRLVPCA